MPTVTIDDIEARRDVPTLHKRAVGLVGDRPPPMHSRHRGGVPLALALKSAEARRTLVAPRRSAAPAWLLLVGGVGLLALRWLV